MAPLGSLAWARATRGRLSFTDRLTLLRQGAVSVLRENTGRALGLGRAEVTLAMVVEPPASELAAAAEQVARTACAPWLLNHCLRTYLWAAVMGGRDGLRFDAEMLYAASLLHDLGICPAFPTPAGECFALSGAEFAERHLVSAGWPAGRATRIADAISLHLNVVVPAGAHGPEAHLLRAATALDVVGQGAHRFPSAFFADSFARHPRLDFKREVTQVMAQQARNGPRTRIGFLCGPVRLLSRVKAAPFPE